MIQHVQCECGKRLKIRASASRLIVARCPNCDARLERRNGEWQCIPKRSSLAKPDSVGEVHEGKNAESTSHRTNFKTPPAMIQHVQCECGKRLKIPASASRLIVAKCPYCDACLERRNGQWQCVSKRSPLGKPDSVGEVQEGRDAESTKHRANFKNPPASTTQFKCECGKRLKIPASASRLIIARCPNCDARLERRNGQWQCVSKRSSLAKSNSVGDVQEGRDAESTKHRANFKNPPASTTQSNAVSHDAFHAGPSKPLAAAVRREITDGEIDDIRKSLSVFGQAEYRDFDIRIVLRHDNLGYDAEVTRAHEQIRTGKQGQSRQEAQIVAVSTLLKRLEVLYGDDPAHQKDENAGRLVPLPSGERVPSEPRDVDSYMQGPNLLNPLGGLCRCPAFDECPDELSQLVQSIRAKHRCEELDKWANIRFGKRFFDLDAASQKKVVISEEIHLAERFEELVCHGEDSADNATTTAKATEPCSHSLNSVRPAIDHVADLKESSCVAITKNEKLAAPRVNVAPLSEIRPPNSNNSDDHGDTSHSRVREALTEMFAHDAPRLCAVAPAIALAAHPWPDKSVSIAVLEAIAAEMLPAKNICHHEIREVATDRLLRFADALQHEGELQLAMEFSDAANQLQCLDVNSEVSPSLRGSPRLRSTRDLLFSPYGIGIPIADTIQGSALERNCRPSTDDEADRNALTDSVAHILGLAAESGASDIGLIHGGESTGITVQEIARRLQITLPLDAFDDHIAQLDSRSRYILTSRIFTIDPVETLVEVAARWGISRERVRQLEMPLKVDVTNRFSRTLMRLGRPPLERHMATVVRTKTLHAAARSITSGSNWQDVAAAVILDLLGPWKNTEGWAIHPSIESRVCGLRPLLDAIADSHGILDDQAVEDALRGLFNDEAEEEEFLTDVVGLGRTCGLWTIKNTLRCRIAAALRHLGRPSTKEEIAELVGLPPENLGSTLSTIEGVVRADKIRWGFDEWVEDEYDGIAGEIIQRIDENGGAVHVNVILRDVPKRFDVTVTSVKAYLTSDAFVIEDGIVRHASIGDFSPRPPMSFSDAVQVGEYWGQSLRLFARHFAGYSLGVRFDIAYANGLRPGDDLIVPVVGHGGDASLIWRSHNLNRTMDVGRVSEFLESAGFQDGDEIVVVPKRDSVEVFSREDVLDRFPPQPTIPLESETSTEESGTVDNGQISVDEVHDPLLDLLGD
jgi:hypothetical protein